MKTQLSIKGSVTIRVYDEKHNIIKNIINSNMIVQSGLEFFMERIIGTSDYEIGEIGIGSGFTAPNLTNTDLESTIVHLQPIDEISPDALNSFVVSTLVENEYSEGLVSEIGLFANDSYGNRILIARTVLTESQRFIKNNNQDISIFWQITLG